MIKKIIKKIFMPTLPERGFTIIELIVYMGLFSILIGILSTVFISLLNNQLSVETTSSTDENGKYILTRLTYDIYQAQNIIIPATIGTQTNNLQLTINNINYSYNLDSSGNLQIKDITNNSGPYNLNDYDATVSGLLFTRIGNTGGKNTIQVSFSIISNTKQKTGQSKTFQTTIGTR
ncbi:MAG TPA: prepilin-type N-terminal cleavage/methylation domain-containing protein [Candidatus Saccharimonadales bacterium]|nr:prepilin-type N-terminal cleavage/methylation domain-containing protein [Candidatus Saccharimonadales bacterium]